MLGLSTVVVPLTFFAILKDSLRYFLAHMTTPKYRTGRAESTTIIENVASWKDSVGVDVLAVVVLSVWCGDR